MFERRLKMLLILPLICGAVLMVRLWQLQVVRGEMYEQLADDALISPKQFLPPLRGSILDRTGRVLVSDEPAYDVVVHYGVISMDDAYLLRQAGRLGRMESQWRSATETELMAEMQRRLERMWTVLHEAGGVSLADLRARRDALCETIEQLRLHIWKARQNQGFDEPMDKLRLKEEDELHPILRDIDPWTRTQIELELSGLPFIRIEPSVRRVWADDMACLCHVLGRMGQVSAGVINDDLQSDDWLACYRPGDLIGVNGVERLGESMLRGKRGFEERRLDGSLNDHAAPIDGLDVQLTIDYDMQRRIAEMLEKTVAENPPSTGASCVVVDIASREILALVSVPTYSAEQFRKDYASLRDNAAGLPLLFRAVQGEYQPGSILKPVALLAGFANRLISANETIFCDGALIPGSDKWHCWTHWRDMPGHGALTAEEAIMHSCNVFFYTIGQRINARRLTDFYRAFICGETSEHDAYVGTGLVEEKQGLIPTLDWMKTRRNRPFRPADGRNYAIGQGEIQITPLEAANAFATLAEGRFRAPTLIANDHRERPTLEFPSVSDEAWRLMRRGLRRCVNENGGTAYKYARLDDIQICGKTGSAQCSPRVTRRRYVFEVADGNGTRQVMTIAPTVEAARESLDLPRDTKRISSKPAERHPTPDPESGKVPTHAWFAGFAPHDKPKIALAVLVEYGGGGGKTAGPVGKAIFEMLLHDPRGYLSETQTTFVTENGE